MIFDETKVYTALNAAQLKPGCEVICADTIYDLKMAVVNSSKGIQLLEILPEDYTYRFQVATLQQYAYAYLVTHDKNIDILPEDYTYRFQVATLQQYAYAYLVAHDKDIEIPFKGKSPVYSTKQAAGADVALPKDITIKANSIVTWIDLEVGFDIPKGFCIMLQPRSSTSRKWHVLCDTGIIDSDYKLENIHCGLVNITNEDITIPKGTRIVQLLILPVYHATNWKCLNNIRDSKKGSGSTGD